MIRSFRHRGLKRLHDDDDASLIRHDLLDKIRTVLVHLDEAGVVEDLRLPGFRLHALKGQRKGYWSVTVRANWRIIFRFEGGDAHDVELVDYH